MSVFGALPVKALLRHLLLPARILVSLFLLALIVGIPLGKVLMNNLDSWRQELAGQIGLALGQSVELGKLSGSFSHFNPVIHIGGAIIKPEKGQTASGFHLQTLLVQLDGLASLRAGRLVLRKLSAQGGTLYLSPSHESASVRPAPEKLPKVAGVNWQELLPLLVTRQLDVRNLHLVTRAAGQTREEDAIHKLTVARLSLSGPPQRRKLQILMRSESGGQIAGKLRLFDLPSELSRADFKGYVSVSKMDFSPWIPFLLPDALKQTGTVPYRLGGSGRFWLSHNLQGWDVRARLQSGHLQMHEDADLPAVTHLAAQMTFLSRQDQPMQLWLDPVAFQFGEHQWSQGGLYLSEIPGTDPQWRLAVNRLPLQTSAGILTALPSLVPDNIRALLAGLKPEGELQNVQVRWKKKNLRSFELRADAHNASVAHWGGVPTLTHVSGRLRMTAHEGELDLDSSDFVLGLKPTFSRPWHFDRAAGRLFWQETPTGYSLRMNHMLLARTQGETIAARMRLDLPYARGQAPFIALEAGISGAQLPDAGRYIPTADKVLSRPLQDWLATAPESGTITQGAFFLNGWLGAKDKRRAPWWGLILDLEQAAVKFRPEWPKVRDLKGRLTLDAEDMLLQAGHARFLDTRISRLEARVPKLRASVPQLRIQARLAGKQDALSHLVHLAPVAQAMGHLADTWTLGGNFDAQLGLQIPLQSDTSPDVQLTLNLHNNSLTLPTGAVKLSQLTGTLSYSSPLNLSSSRLQGLLHDRPVSLDIESQPVTAGSNTKEVQIHARGRMDMQTLARWSRQDITRFVQGETNYDAHITVGSDVKLVVDTDLEGVASSLPPPLHKEALQKRSLQVELEAGKQENTLVSAHLVDMGVHTLMSLDGQGQVVALGVNLGLDEPGLPGEGAVLTGHLESLELSPWIHWWNRPLTQESSQHPRHQPDTQNLLAQLEVRDLTLDRLLWHGEQLTDVNVNLAREKSFWLLDVESPQLAGTGAFPAGSGSEKKTTAEQVWQLDIRKIVLPGRNLSASPEPTQAGQSADFLQAIDPSVLPAMDVRVNQLVRDDNALGHADFSVRHLRQGVRIQDFQGRLAGIRIQGEMDWTQHKGQHRTRVEADLRTRDLQQSNLFFQLGDVISSGRMDGHVNMDWSGSPATFDPLTAQGSARFELKGGRLTSVDTGGGTGALRFLGALNTSAIIRRLKLDFSDLYGSGISYDRVKGALTLDHGVIRLDRPATLESPSSDYSLEGVLDLNSQRVNMGLVVTLPVTKNLPVVGLLMGQPYIAGAVYLFDKVLGKNLRQFASLRYEITGNPKDPEVRLDRLFPGKKR